MGVQFVHNPNFSFAGTFDPAFMCDIVRTANILDVILLIVYLVITGLCSRPKP
jgi:hypothetical protein